MDWKGGYESSSAFQNNDKSCYWYTFHWGNELTRAVMVYNNNYHEEIKMSPSELMLVSAHSPAGMALPRKSSFVWKEGGPGFVPYKPGKKVLKRIELKGKQNVDKFNQKYKGPLMVKKVHPNRVTYEVEKK